MSAALCQPHYINGGTTLSVIGRDFKLDEAAGKRDQIIYPHSALNPLYEGISVDLRSYKDGLDRKIAFRRAVMSLCHDSFGLGGDSNVREPRNALVKTKKNHAKIPIFRLNGKSREYLFKTVLRGALKPSDLIDKRIWTLNSTLGDRDQIKLSNSIRHESMRDEKEVPYFSDLAEWFRVGRISAVDRLAVCGHDDLSRSAQRGDSRTMLRGLGTRAHRKAQHKQWYQSAMIRIRSRYDSTWTAVDKAGNPIEFLADLDIDISNDGSRWLHLVGPTCMEKLPEYNRTGKKP